MWSFRRFPHLFGLGLLLFAGSMASLPVIAQETSGDQIFLSAREAFQKGKRAQLERLAETLKAETHPLADYAEYYLLRQNLEKGDDSGTPDFLQRRNGDWLGERLRSEWLKTLANRADWTELARQGARLAQPDREARCFILLARMRQNESAAFAEARALWPALTDTSDGCQRLMLAVENRLAPEERWPRMRLLAEHKRLKSLRRMLLALPQAPDAKAIDAALDKPASWLTHLAPERLAQRSIRGLVTLALQGLARNDPAFAAGQMARWGVLLDADEAAWVWGQIGLQGALRHMDTAALWFSRSRAAQLSSAGAEWRARSALRRMNWKMVRLAIEEMPEKLQEKPEWIYWRGRALQAEKHEAEARKCFERLSGQSHFYGNLADEELGRTVVLPPFAQAPLATELAFVQTHSGILRALLLFRLDLRLEALREWNWSTRGMTDRQLLAAAEVARQNGLYDRAIHSADRTRGQHDYRLRYLSPFLEQVRPIARERGVEETWIYGLMRQESRFVIAAKSSVGAAGLMQLMPATARWVANRIGLSGYNPRHVHDPDINLRLGVAYMQMTLEALDDHPLLASAAYNAGPGRARKWKADIPLEGAIYAETIPFDETRDYVKKVMSNTHYYALLFNGKSPPLHARLGTVAGRTANAPPIALP
ncbi:MAG: lytic transglycosylase domain-containing protein [Zoogloeaceae bacterium]|jgi:soluble lytic murein transglycosylase|nr:lytic transglycosylase domain-containing protein [Zoogloeaceae bacterium]